MGGKATLTDSPSDIFGEKAASKSCVLPSKEESGSSPLNPQEKLVYVRYRDHVLYNRCSALVMQPQIREAVGWLIYQADDYIIISWDRDAGPPTLHGGDPKASGLVLLKSDILHIVIFIPRNRNSELNLKSKHTIEESEYAFRPSERKTQKRAKSSKGEN